MKTIMLNVSKHLHSILVAVTMTV